VQIKDIYVLNILKCLPTDITNISSQVQICKPYVKKQIDIINPKVIVVFGEISQYLIDSQDYNNIKLIPTYHPSFLLKNPSLKRDALEDLKKVKSIIEAL
jgi:DNA polymerase